MSGIEVARVWIYCGVAVTCTLLSGCGKSSSNVEADYQRKIGGKRAMIREIQDMTSDEIPILRFSVQPGFRGEIEVRRDSTNGLSLPTNGVISIPVPSDGHVRVKNFYPFEHEFRLTAQYTNGLEITNAAWFPTVPPPDAVIIDGGGAAGGTRYPPDGVYLFFVGNEGDRKGPQKK